MFAVNPGAGTALGGTAGGLLGQVGDVLSMPRRHLWNMIGAPFGVPEEATQSGASLLGYMGMDQENPWVQALGLGAEIAGDPLTYMGGLLGRAGAVMSRGNVADDLARATAMRQSARSGLVEHALAQEANLAQNTDRMRRASRMVDLDYLMNEGAINTKPFARPNPALADDLINAGLAREGDMGFELTRGVMPDWGYQTPAGNPGSLNITANRAGGVRLPSVRANEPPYATFHTSGETLRPTGVGNLPTPEEINMLRREAASQLSQTPAGLRPPMQPSVGSIHNPGVSPNSVADAIAQRLAAESAPPMPRIAGMAADELFSKSQDDIAMLLARIDMMNDQAGYVDDAVKLGAMAALGGGSFSLGMNAWGGQ